MFGSTKKVCGTPSSNEGGEQGDPLMPLLFSPGIHNASEEIQQQLEPGESLFAFLDDVYVLCSPERTRVLYNLLNTTLRERAGIRLHTGKTRTWNFAGERPVDLEDLGPDVWNPEGIKILGTPVGHPEFLSTFVEQRLVEERKLWDAIPSVPDLQCAWQLLLQCAGPRCHHLLRIVPPSQLFRYAPGHDAGMQRAMEVLLGSLPGDDAQVEMARHITTLPLRMGGLGLRSALRMAPAAFWASWADALPMLQQRLPELTRQVLHVAILAQAILAQVQVLFGVSINLALWGTVREKTPRVMPGGRTWQFNEELPMQLGSESSEIIGHHQSSGPKQVSSKSVRLACTGAVDGGGSSRGLPRTSPAKTIVKGRLSGLQRSAVLQHGRGFHSWKQPSPLSAKNSTGPEVVALQQPLKKARTDAEGMPLAIQLKECQLFVERNEKKIASIDQERAHEMKLLEEGRARLERLRKEVEILQQRPHIAPQIPANIPGEVQKLQAMVAQLQSEKEERSKKKDSPRLPEDFVCASDEDPIRWLGDQKDLNDALMAGNAGEVARMVVLVNDGTNQLRQWIGQSGAEGSGMRPSMVGTSSID